MKRFKKEHGYTLLEMVLVIGFIGILLFLLGTSYLSVYTTHIKASRKAENLEEARIIINFINDTFQKYEMESCEIVGNGKTKELEDQEEGIVKQIIFKDNNKKIVIKYNNGDQIMTFQTQEVGSGLTSFSVRRSDQFLDFNCIVEKGGKDIEKNQSITVGTTVNLQYK